MKSKLLQTFTLLVLLSWCGVVKCGPGIADTKSLIDTLFADYRTYILPVADQHTNVSVGISLLIKSIQSFDEVAETFSFAGALGIDWHDVSLIWDPNLYNQVGEVVLPYNKVWVPNLILSSAATSRNSIEQSWNTVRVASSGTVSWIPANLFESTCAVNVRNYPFDTQVCDVAFFSLGYISNEVSLRPTANKVDVTLLQPNALWSVVDSGVKVQVITSGESEITFSVHLRRKSSFVIVNVVLPILFLSLLNICVFLLVPESGERIGYCITALLAIAVYMTIIADMLPQSSEPVPIISYKLMVDMIISALIVFVTILTMKMHNTDDDVPVTGVMLKLYRLFACCRRRRVTIHPEEMKRNEPDAEAFKPVFKNEVDKSDDKEKPRDTDEIDKMPTWRDVGKTTDIVALIFFFALSAGSFIVFICVTKYG